MTHGGAVWLPAFDALPSPSLAIGEPEAADTGLLTSLTAVCRAWWDARPARGRRIAPARLWGCAGRIATRMALLAAAGRRSPGLANAGSLAAGGTWDDLVERLVVFDPGGFGALDAPWPMPADAVSVLVARALEGAEGGLSWPGEWYAASLGRRLERRGRGLALVEDSRRATLGAHHTPPSVAARLAARTLEAALAAGEAGLDPVSLRVVDPAVGGGALLLAWFEAVLEHAPERPRGPARVTDHAWRARRARAVMRLHGVDIDPFAAAIARAALWIAAEGSVDPAVLARNIVSGCALAGADGWKKRLGPESFDIVLANPPYLDNKRIAPALKRAIAAGGFRCARGLYDLSVPFVERCLDLMGPRGILGVLVPNKIATRDYGEPLRRELAARCAMVELAEVDDRYGPGVGSGFGDAAVYPLALVARCGQPGPEERVAIRFKGGTAHVTQATLGRMPRAIWPRADGVALIERVLGRAQGSEARYLGRDLGRGRYRPCGFAWQAHLDAVVDRKVARALRFVGCASVRPFAVDWSLPFRLGGRRCHQAWLTRPDSVGEEAWADLCRPKLLVREVATELSCAGDLAGHYAHLTGLHGYVDLDPALPIEYVAGVLNSAPIRAFYAALFWNGHLSGGYLDIKGSYLALVPILPASSRDRARVVTCARRLAVGPDANARRTLDRRVRAIYGLEP